MPYSNIAESLLEMHYFRLMVRCYRQLLGPNIQVFKPATTAEHWYGFDQAFFTSNSSKPETITDIRQFIHSNTAPRYTSFRAFLLQFKVVEMARRRSKYSPMGWHAPYFRSEVYLRPNDHTGVSQHEALRRLSNLAGASVAYVCPMIFEENDVLKQPRMADLRFVDVSGSPSGWSPTDRHFIAFQDQTSQPNWCSKPVMGKSLELEQILDQAKPLKAEAILKLLEDFQKVLLPEARGETQQILMAGEEINILPACLSIVAEVG